MKDTYNRPGNDTAGQGWNRQKGVNTGYHNSGKAEGLQPRKSGQTSSTNPTGPSSYKPDAKQNTR